MEPARILKRYRELQQYVGWGPDHAVRLRAVAKRLVRFLPDLMDDLFAEIERLPHARKVLAGGDTQVQRLKAMLTAWLQELLQCGDDDETVLRRWRAGRRHVEIGLDQVYTNAALSRLRKGLIRNLATVWTGTPQELVETIEALNLIFDLDRSVIQEAYHTEYTLRLQRSGRLSAIGQISGGIAHELRDPLNAVKTSVYYLRHARQLTPEKLGEHLGRINRQVDRADAVITALSDFARMPVPDLRRIRVRGAIQQAVGAQQIPAGIRVRMDVDRDLMAWGDADQLQIVLGNLIRNAVDAMPEGGVVSIKACEREGAAQISVSDTGVGILPDDLTEILEPLYTTKSRGMGLGLAITRAIVDKHQAKMEIESQPGRGSKFTVHLKPAERAVVATACDSSSLSL